MAYSHTTWLQAKQQLAARLQDSSNTHWTDTGTYSELGLYLTESLRTWNVLTGYWRARATFSTSSGTAFYDLPTQIPSLRGYNVLDKDVVAEIQFHLMEPATPTAWSGTEMFVLSDLTNALQRRRNQFLAETGCRINRSTQAASAATRITLSDTIIALRRLAWQNSDNRFFLLSREDEWTLANFIPTWESTAVTAPYAYSVSASPPVTVAIAPLPTASGTLEILAVEAGANLNPAAGVLLGIPDDFSWIVKWGALADLLSKDGQAKDPYRAQYCERRYREGVALAHLSATVINAELTRPLTVNPLWDMDHYNSNWENASGTPTDIAMTGLNLMAFSPVPNSAVTVTLDVVQNAPIPATDATQLQLGREELEAVLGYAEHLALFKEGDVDFQSTLHYWDNMVQMATNYNSRVAAAVKFAVPQADQSKGEEFRRPMDIPAEGFGTLVTR